MISSSCTCPNDWGNVCEHEVAIANEIDSTMTALSAFEISLLSKKVRPKSTPKKHEGIFTFSFKDVKEFDKEVFLKYRKPPIFSQGNAVFVGNVFSEVNKETLNFRRDY
jgi:hypothetical protein